MPLHSSAVGALLALFPRFAMNFGGFGGPAPMFFPRQAGVFHVVLASGYLLEHFRHRGVFLPLVAKGAAAVFLLSVAAASDVPWAVPFSGVADGLMGAAVWAAHRGAASRGEAGNRCPGRLAARMPGGQRSGGTNAPDSSSKTS